MTTTKTTEMCLGSMKDRNLLPPSWPSASSGSEWKLAIAFAPWFGKCSGCGEFLGRAEPELVGQPAWSGQPTWPGSGCGGVSRA